MAGTGTSTRAVTFTNTGNDYATATEANVVDIILENAAVKDKMEDPAKLIGLATELAGVGRLHKYVEETTGEYASSVNRHYDVAAQLLIQLGMKDEYKARHLGADIVKIISAEIPTETGQKPIEATIRGVLLRLEQNEIPIRVGNGGDLTQEAAFALGVATHVLGGEDRHHWDAREGISIQDLFDRRGLQREIPGVRSYWREMMPVPNPLER